MKMKALSALVCGMLLLGATAGRAAGTDGGKRVLDLNDCIRNALTVAPELGESQADIDLAASKLAEAKAHRYPQVDFLGLIGPVPQARGNQVSSPDSINQTDRLTWFTRGDATLVQPLYTFGKISESMKAASHGIEVDRAKKEQRRNEVTLQVKEYYYGLLLARELKEVVLEVQEDLDKARKKAREYLDKGSPNVDDLDIYKLDAFSGEVAKYLEEARKGEELALAALRTRIGLPPDAPFDIATGRLTPDETVTAPLPTYLDASRTQRPEYRQVREGLLARQALVEAAKAAYWPDFFLGGYLSAAYAEKRDRVSNPWVPDQFNHLWGGVALGLKWKLDFGITGAKVAAEQARYDRLLSTRTYAETNIPLQIRKAYLELQEAEKSITATRDAYTNAKKWVVAALANFDFGIGPAKEIFDGLENYAKMRGDYFRSIYNQKMSRANLDYAIGASPLEQR
ncbi:TolC family protein [Geobacter sp.]|uniref:TolC family protein n=1 Tax=Geobacter sp. TaxID=46610 RepID=UPI00261E99FA|nr:TolC family protein [Geobacter sp.]